MCTLARLDFGGDEGKLSRVPQMIAVKTRLKVGVGDVYDVLDTPEDTRGLAPIIYGVDGTHGFFGATATTTNRVSFRTFELGQTTTTAIACDIAALQGAVVDQDAIYVLETRGPTADNLTTQVRKIAR